MTTETRPAQGSASHKRCSRCGETKPLSEFGRNSRTRDNAFAYCRPCGAAKTREWRAAHPEHWAQWSAEHHDEILARRRARRADKDYRLRESLRDLHGLSVEEFNVQLAAQSVRCAICHERPKEGRLHVDHDHGTGRFRGLLCGSCNKAFGLFHDDLDRLKEAVRYIGVMQLAEALGL